ncbi:MAG: hypothetical protein CR986_08435 [Ignavibacteriae bacterium]|nr:MAG: hypothetical protein CR986_08435 [Ignavibacteriota bacterium]
MIGKKKRIKKKEIQEDKLVSTYYQTQEFIEKYKQNIIIVVAVIAVIVVATVWYMSKKKEDNLIASNKLSQIVSVYEKGEYQKAIDGEPGTQLEGLKAIVENYGNTEQGEIAKIYLANSYYSVGNYENALEQYENYSGSSKLHKAAALAGMASCYEMQNKFSEAAEKYKAAAKEDKLKSQNASYLLNAGINYLKADEKEEAKTVFQLVKKDYTQTAAAQEVDKYLLQL